MLGQRRRRWADVVQILHKCFVLTGLGWSCQAIIKDIVQGDRAGALG